MWSPTHVQVTVYRARNLLTKGKGGTNDAYVTIKLGPEKYQTSIKERSKDPEWMEECDLPLSERSGLIHLNLYHRNLLGLDEFLGHTDLALEDFPVHERPRSRWYALKNKVGSKKPEKYRGEIEAKVTLIVQSLAGSVMSLNKSSKVKRSSSIRTLAQDMGDRMKGRWSSKGSLNKSLGKQDDSFDQSFGTAYTDPPGSPSSSADQSPTVKKLDKRDLSKSHTILPTSYNNLMEQHECGSLPDTLREDEEDEDEAKEFDRWRNVGHRASEPFACRSYASRAVHAGSHENLHEVEPLHAVADHGTARRTSLSNNASPSDKEARGKKKLTLEKPSFAKSMFDLSTTTMEDFTSHKRAKVDLDLRGSESDHENESETGHSSSYTMQDIEEAEVDLDELMERRSDKAEVMVSESRPVVQAIVDVPETTPSVDEPMAKTDQVDAADDNQNARVDNLEQPPTAYREREIIEPPPSTGLKPMELEEPLADQELRNTTPPSSPTVQPSATNGLSPSLSRLETSDEQSHADNDNQSNVNFAEAGKSVDNEPDHVVQPQLNTESSELTQEVAVSPSVSCSKPSPRPERKSVDDSHQVKEESSTESDCPDCDMRDDFRRRSQEGAPFISGSDNVTSGSGGDANSDEGQKSEKENKESERWPGDGRDQAKRMTEVNRRHTLQFGKRNVHKVAAHDLHEGILEYKKAQDESSVKAKAQTLPEEVMEQFKELSREDLIKKILEQRLTIQKKDAANRDLESYIDNLLVKVMEETPKLLQNPASPLARGANNRGFMGAGSRPTSQGQGQSGQRPQPTISNRNVSQSSQSGYSAVSYSATVGNTNLMNRANVQVLSPTSHPLAPSRGTNVNTKVHPGTKSTPTISAFNKSPKKHLNPFKKLQQAMK